MKYWLLKSEPDAYSWDDLVKEKEGCWDGVRNYQARNNLALMEVGDLAFFYHSVSDKCVVGVAEITQTAFPDPTTDDKRWLAIRLKPFKKLQRVVKLETIKKHDLLQNIALIRQSRLSVMPIEPAEFDVILQLGE